MGPTPRSVPTAPALERGLAILEHLARHPEGQGISDLSSALSLPLNSVFRFINTLQAQGYVVRDAGSKKYTLTRKPSSLAYGSESDRTLMENAIDLMRDLRDLVRETVVVSIVDRGEGFILEQVPGLHPFRFVVEHGARQVLNTSASCKAILAWMRSAERDAQLARCPFEAHTARTITDRDVFIAELKRVRSHGWAEDRGEALDGVHCLAAAVRDRSGAGVAAITVTGPAQRLRERDFATVGVQVRDCAARISARLGFGLVDSTAAGAVSSS